MIRLSKPVINKEEMANLREVLDSGLLARGRFNCDFENSFAGYIGTKFAVSVSNGTAALHAALLASGISPGDTVITTPFSFIATANAIIHCGARIVFADIDPLTFNISADEMEKVLRRRGNKIKAAVITHLYGLPCRMDRIMRLVRKYNLILIEDCAQAHGAEFKGRKAGAFGNIATFSFYGSKNMTTGEGGMITTDNKRLYQKCARLADQGRSSRFIHSEIGFNYRMSNLAAAIGLAQLKKIDLFNNKRRRNAQYLSKRLKDIAWITVPQEAKDLKHVFHQYTIQVSGGRDRLVAHLKNNSIEAGANYPLPIHRQPAYKKLGYGKCVLPGAQKAAARVVNLPVHPSLKKKDLDKIIKAVREWKK